MTSTSLMGMKITITLSISLGRYFCIITQLCNCRLFERVFRSNRSTASVDKLLGGKLSRTLAALF